MTLKYFLDSPWKTPHPAYDSAIFNMRPAPEFATAEVVLASTYRAAGFQWMPESQVPTAGRRLDKASDKTSKAPQDSVSSETWHSIIHGVLESPKQPNQSSKRFIQMCPLVPEVSIYSGSARLAGSPWNPGTLVQRMIRLGSPTSHDAESLWLDLYNALSVSETDDIWARWLQAEFNRRRCWPEKDADKHTWAPTDLPSAPCLFTTNYETIRAPVCQFNRDLRAVIACKPQMTRRQWLSLLEAILRIGTVTHVLWTCDLNDRVWNQIRTALIGTPTAIGSGSNIWNNYPPLLMYGQSSLPSIRKTASRYLVARLAINLVLWKLDEAGITPPKLEGAAGIVDLTNLIHSNRDRLDHQGLLAHISNLQDTHNSAIACKKGIGANIVEYCRYALGRRLTADDTLRSYDQGYLLRKGADYTAAPWIVALGPVALLALVHCCLSEVSGPRSVKRLCEHLSHYGIAVDVETVAQSHLGADLRLQGLVLDSPDAESGMLLLPPFPHAMKGQVKA